MKKNVFVTQLLLMTGFLSFGQDGFLRGKVIDETSGEALFGATVVKQGTTIGAVADFDGNYSLSLPAGTHTVVFQSVGFMDVVAEQVNIEAGKATILDMVLKEDVQQLGEVVVTAEVVKDNDVGVLLVQKKSINTLDGISSSTFRKLGDSDLSGAMKRVTGVSIQGDKYVYVRGLGDRYTKTSVNGMLIPGLDPDRNDVQIDIFPTGILENVIVYKTFSPDLPGSFTGGLVDIQTKSFPDEKSTSASVSLGYNPDMNLNSNYLTYDGSSTDFLGFDNGARDLPVNPDIEIESDNATTSLFDPTLGAKRETSSLNKTFSFSHRNQIVGNKFTWGYNALFTYRNNYNYFEGFERRRYERANFGSGTELLRDYTAKGDLASNEVLWSGLISVAAKKDNTTIGTTLIHIQNGVSTSLDRTRQNTSLNNPTFLYNDILTYTQRHLTNNILYGKHQFDRLRVEWTNSLIWSRQYEPDYREVNINEDDNGQLVFQNGGFINRFWRDLSEVNESFKLDFTYELNQMNKLKLGGMYSTRSREFSVFSYNYINLNSDDVSSTDPNELLLPSNIVGSSQNPNGPAINNATIPSNSYDGKYNILGVYLMNEMQITDKLKSIYGVRLETAKIKYTGLATPVPGEPEVFLNDEPTLDETNLLPSVNLIYNINKDMNLRASVNKTLARPSFREKSSAFINDPISNIFFIGNVNTKQAEIMNYDLRWEYFMTPSELLSVSVFYKNFKNHIAIVAFDIAPNQVTPRNVGSAEAYGTEIEFRKNLAPFASFLTNFSLGSNFSYTISRVDRTTVAVDETGESEYDSEANTLGSTETVDRYRNMSQQAPYSINAFLSYETADQDISANLSYNVQGETLTFVSSAEVPEVYTQPFHSLNFKVSKGIGENSNISLRVTNILKDKNELFYKLDNEQGLFSKRAPGTTYTIKYSINF